MNKNKWIETLQIKLLKNKFVNTKLKKLVPLVQKHLDRVEYDLLLEYMKGQLDAKDLQKDAVMYQRFVESNLKYVYQSKSILSGKYVIDLSIKVLDRLKSGIGQVISLQPITGPVGQVFYMQYQNEEGKAIDTSNPLNEQLGVGRKMSLAIVSQVVEATKKLDTYGIVDHNHDAKDYELDAMARDITKEVTDYIIKDIMSKCKSDELKLKDFAFVTDLADNISPKIAMLSNEIAMDTRLGGGNFVIGSPMLITLLQSNPNANFVPPAENTSDPDADLIFAGTVNGSTKVYMYMFPVSNEDALDMKDKALIGYKGAQSPFYAGYVYSPYLISASSTSIVNPVTYQVSFNMTHRYGTTYHNAGYYRTLELDLGGL